MADTVQAAAPTRKADVVRMECQEGKGAAPERLGFATERAIPERIFKEPCPMFDERYM